MTNTFDSGLTEYSTVLGDHLVHIYKVGGGTRGRRYEGLWGYKMIHQGALVASGEDLNTGTPKTHDEAARIALDIILDRKD